MHRPAPGHSCASWLTIVLAMTFAAVVVPAHAQVLSADPPRVEFTLSPGGTIVFPDKESEPGFTNYRFGGALTVHLARLVAFEAEAGASFGLSRLIGFGIAPHPDHRSPNTLDYNGNLVINLRTDTRVVPYLTAGAGAITLFSRKELGFDNNENYFTGNAGGGLQWLRHGRWGVRADYRFMAVRSKSDAPAFFGRTNRYAHRVYGAAILTLDNAK